MEQEIEASIAKQSAAEQMSGVNKASDQVACLKMRLSLILSNLISMRKASQIGVDSWRTVGHQLPNRQKTLKKESSDVYDTVATRGVYY